MQRQRADDAEVLQKVRHLHSKPPEQPDHPLPEEHYLMTKRFENLCQQLPEQPQKGDPA